MADGRFAPSPTAPLHLGNLRTALVAWLAARSSGSRFLLRVEDLDALASRPEHEASAIADLAALGLDHDGDVVRQSERREIYSSTIARLVVEDRTYPCYCTRREVLAESRDSIAAPHGVVPSGAYPGTCSTLDRRSRVERAASGRGHSLRLRAEGASVTFIDRLAGECTGVVDDFVIRRVDGAPAYNLAVVVDDADQGVGEVVRGDDLLGTTPRQVFLATLLDVPVPMYTHVALVVGPDGGRLAKRHGSVTLDDQRTMGRRPEDVLSLLAGSLGLAEPGEPVTAADLVARFDVSAIPRTVWKFPADVVAGLGGGDRVRGDRVRGDQR
jgi:glutamyl-tRNA synthetase